MSAKSLGNLLIASAKKNEIQSPLVLPLPSIGISPDSCSAVCGAKKSDGRHCIDQWSVNVRYFVINTHHKETSSTIDSKDVA